MPGVSMRLESVLGELRAALFVLACGCALAACGGDGGSAPAHDEDAGEEGGAATSDDGGDAGADDEADTGAQTDADAQASDDLSGTWIAKIETLATASVPLAGEIDVQLELAL